MSADRGWVKILNSDNDLRRSLAFGGSPWKVEVERAMGIEPTYLAWEAQVLPLNDARNGLSVRQALILAKRGARFSGTPLAARPGSRGM